MNQEQNAIPRHIAIIMDGNGRWATERGQERTYGHKAGVDTVRRITAECVRMGVKYLTLYTFSTENWNRPDDEVSALMGLVLSSLEDEIFMKQKLWQTEQRTAHNSAMTMVVALSYSSRWEITQAVRDIAEEAQKGLIRSVADIDEDYVARHMATSFMPDPDLLIRTGGECRISNYLLWQIAYSELYFCDTYWPDFAEEHLHKAIESYQQRQRRFGKTEAQVEQQQQ